MGPNKSSHNESVDSQDSMDGGGISVKDTDGSPEDDPYQQFLTVLYSIIDSSMDAARFEEECRRLAGTHAF